MFSHHLFALGLLLAQNISTCRAALLELPVGVNALSPKSTSAIAIASTTSSASQAKRSAIPSCLKTVELSCLNLAANCLSHASFDSINRLWNDKACVAAATCYGVGDLITSIECQTLLTTTNSAQAALNTTIFSTITGCSSTTAGCVITQQNYIDFYYGMLVQVNSANQPSSSAVVKTFWAAVTNWTATGTSSPYKNFNDYLHVSTFPATTTTTPPATAIPTYSFVTWNPNPYPPATAKSETFVRSATTVIVAIPTSTTSITVGGAIITLNSGGTPVNAPVPTDVTQVGAITPTWTFNIQPPASASTVTFTAPPSYTTIVPVPTASSSPPKNITGPPGDHNRDGNDWWLLGFGGIVLGLLPPDVGIPGGTTPTATPPPSWTGGWKDPSPTSSSSSSSSSPSTSTTCHAVQTDSYTLSDDPQNANWVDDGTDPDTTSKRKRYNKKQVERRAFDPRHIKIAGCTTPVLSVSSPAFVSLNNVPGAAWLTVGPKGGTTTNLNLYTVGSRPHEYTAQEHVFELGLISQFFNAAPFSLPGDCGWIDTNIFQYTLSDGRILAAAIIAAIDALPNMVWVDTPMNQAKSNVVNNNANAPNTPPQKSNIDQITDFDDSEELIYNIEFFLRNIAALGDYFGVTANLFEAVAVQIQNLLAEVTPTVPISPSLPTRWNAFLHGLANRYPTGCSNRASWSHTYYMNQMNDLVTSLQQPVPPCFPLYHSLFYNPSTFNGITLMPPAPNLPSCNTPGTAGQISLDINSNGNPNFMTVGGVGIFKIMGSGNTNFYAFGSGPSISGIHWQAASLTPTYPANCANSYHIFDAAPFAGSSIATISFLCPNGVTGKAIVSFAFDVNNAALSCRLLNYNDGSNNFDIICGPGGTIGSCGTSILGFGSNPVNYPHAAVSTPSFAFYPN